LHFLALDERAQLLIHFIFLDLYDTFWRTILAARAA
jgi:hypothetical protein